MYQDVRVNPPLFCTTVVIVCALSYLTTYQISSILGAQAWALALMSLCLVLLGCCILLICRQPQTSKKVSFMVGGSWTLSFHCSPTLLSDTAVLSPPPPQVPLLPFLPILSVLVNIYLMFQLSGDTWIRFSVWMAVGEFLLLLAY